MKVLNKKQVIDRYGEDKYYELQGWLHGDGRPTKGMVLQTMALMLGQDDVDVSTVDRWGTLEFHRDCYGYVYLVDSAHPSELIPAIVLYHNFGDRNNYIPDVR